MVRLRTAEDQIAGRIKAVEAEWEGLVGPIEYDHPEPDDLRSLTPDDVSRRREKLVQQQEVIRAQIAKAEAETAKYALAAELLVAARDSTVARDKAVDGLRSKTAWAASALLGAIVALAVAGQLENASTAAVSRVLWYSGLAVTAAASNNILLIVAHGAVEAAAALARRNVRWRILAGPVTGLRAATRFLPTAIVTLELAFTGAAALNLRVVLETISETA
ncbi:MAG: hypothetical protein ACYC2H_06515 [Thermoplasmatota archaeon]